VHADAGPPVALVKTELNGDIVVDINEMDESIGETGLVETAGEVAGSALLRLSPPEGDALAVPVSMEMEM
jgi:hypothetical protein